MGTIRKIFEKKQKKLTHLLCVNSFIFEGLFTECTAPHNLIFWSESIHNKAFADHHSG